MIRALRTKWPVPVPIAAALLLVASLFLPMNALVVVVCVVALAAVVIAAVHHAEVVAHRVGEPFGTLVLAIAITVIEVALVMSMSGTAYAVATVTGKDIKDESVTGKDVKNGSLAVADLRPAAVSQFSEPGPRGERGEPGERGAGPIGQPLAAGRIVEAVPQAPDFARGGRCGQRGEIGERRQRIIGRQHLPAGGEPARFLEMQVGDDQRTAFGPEQRASRERGEGMTGERKANHRPAMARAPRTINGACVGIALGSA